MEDRGIMVRRSLRSRILIAVVSATLAATLVGTWAAAKIPDSGGVIHGCFKVQGGALRVIHAEHGVTCGTGEKPLNWAGLSSGS